MIKPSRPSELLLYSTVRLVTTLKSGEEGFGTGFFYLLESEEQNLRMRVIVTNKHVIEDAVTLRFIFHRANCEGDGTTSPSGEFIPLEVTNFANLCVYHPDNEIDLVAILFEPIEYSVEQIFKTTIFAPPFVKDLIKSDEELADLSPIEDIIMVGYPIGLWDDYNNFPIMRRGMTATHPAVDYCGNSEGLIDATCLPGSSGSPVLLFNEGSYPVEQGVVLGNRITLLGVLFAGPEIDIEGRMCSRFIPVNEHAESVTTLMMNLGCIVKAKEILKLSEYIFDNLANLERKVESIGSLEIKMIEN